MTRFRISKKEQQKVVFSNKVDHRKVGRGNQHNCPEDVLETMDK